MSLLALSEVSFEYPSGPVLFADVSFSINPADCVAIVGANGVGKSTLLGLLAGDLEPTRGRIVRRRELRIVSAAQDVTTDGSQTLFECVFAARASLAARRSRILELEKHLSDPQAAGEYASEINRYQELGGFLAETEIARPLAGLGFSAGDWERDIGSLSGGERTRAALACALSAEADLLVLDEPTNHLDIEARRWLEASLASRSTACVISSHDRALVGAFARRVIEIDRSKVRIFEGSYEEYRAARALLDEQAWSAYEAFERRKTAVERAANKRDQLACRVAATPDGIRASKDFYAAKSAKVARTGRILRERVSDDKRVEKPWEESPIEGLSFDRVGRSGDVVLSAVKLTKSYTAKILFQNLTFHVRRGDRLAIAGSNGTGKTTLLKIIEGAILPDSGWVRFGGNVKLASVAQNPVELNLSLTPLEICGSDTNARTLLACLKLRPDRVNHPLEELSGGERTKVALARVLNSGANLLLLDEPTNHLEIEAQEALGQALERYPGTIIIVSHDRAFLETLGDDVTLLNLRREATPIT